MLRNKAMHMHNKERQRRYTAGFTMAEMLIVVAIIGVLAAVSFIAVQAHQKSMTQLQYDAIAKEIFVAAQNHLTLAKSENYQQKSDLTDVMASGFFGTQGKAADDTNDDVYYFTSTSSNAGTALDQILPLGAVELVTGGKYIIRYQPIAARVLDVFYWTDDAKYGIGSMAYDTAVGTYSGMDKKSDRAKIGGNGVLGWCGGEEVVDSGKYLEAPEIEVINAEMLLVKVTNPNTDKSDLFPQLKLIVSGIQSGAMVAIPLSLSGSGRIVPIQNDQSYTVVLDSITDEGMHFADLMNEGYEFKKNEGLNLNFIPGENITIKAVAYSNKVLTSVAYSGEWTTNSLFDEVEEDAGEKKIKISNIRHLENLNDDISSLAYTDGYFNSTIKAVQTVDLDWSAFKTNLNVLKKTYINNSTDKDEPVNIYDKDKASTKDDCFLPVSVNYTLNYDGQSDVEISETTGTGENATTTTKTFTENHRIKGVVVDNTGDAGTATVTPGGVFGSLTGGEIRNLELIDTKVTLASGNAGALAGTLSVTKVSNVLAYNTSKFETELAETDETKTAVSIKTSGSVGGLIGFTTNCTIEKSAAALIVSSTSGNAGGLIGTSDGGTVSGCYSGGHTINKLNGTGTDAEAIGVIYDESKYNVTGSGVAGGLIGDAGATTISYSYSTCSATGATVGGLIGTGSGEINNSYCTGLVKSTAATPVEGAFAGTYTGTPTDCYYYDIINERDEVDESGNPTGGYTYLNPVHGSETVTGLESIDKTAQSYNDFCGASGDWWIAMPYNDKLKAYYGDGTGADRVAKYNLKTIAQLDAAENKVVGVVEEDTTTNGVTTPADFVATHYGDWPAPEIFVVNN